MCEGYTGYKGTLSLMGYAKVRIGVGRSITALYPLLNRCSVCTQQRFAEHHRK